MPPPANIDSATHRYASGAARAWTTGWRYDTARKVVDDAVRGYFVGSYQLGIDISAHPAIKAAREQRVAAATSLPYTIAGPDRAPHRFETDAAIALWSQAQRLLDETVDDVAIHGFAVWQHPVDIIETEQGPRHIIREIERWPLSCVEHGSAILADPKAGPYAPDRFYARSAAAVNPDGTPADRPRYVLLPRPGETDLHWTVFGTGDFPHRRGAIIALPMCFVGGQLGRRAMAKMLSTIGRTSPIGELPENIKTLDVKEDGTVSENPIATDMLEALVAVGETQTAMIHMKGARVYPFEVNAQTGNLFPQWMQIDAQAIQWAILGHDRAIAEGDTYTDPKAQSVPQDLTRRDVGAIERGFSALVTGLARMNAERCGPIELRGHLPDVDQDDRRKAENERRAADDAHRAAQLAAAGLAAAQVKLERDAGLLVDADRVAYLYAVAGVEGAKLPAGTPDKVPEVFAYDLEGGVLTRGTAATLKGLPLPPHPEETVPEFRARLAAQPPQGAPAPAATARR